MPDRPETYYEAISAAVAELSETGFTSQDRLNYWQERIRAAAERSMSSFTQMEELLREGMTAIYKRLVENGGSARYVGNVARFTLEQLKPKLRADLDRRILASANLIKLNREQAIAKTLQRFSGWATSVPPGGSATVNKVDEKAQVKKALAALPFEERRVLIDQGQKLTASINETIALGSGAIAAIWHSHKGQLNYDGRPAHNARDGKIFAIRGNWALEKGLMNKGPNGYTDEIEAPAEFVFCRCYYTYLHNLRQLPETMLTAKGKLALAEARKRIQEL